VPIIYEHYIINENEEMKNDFDVNNEQRARNPFQPLSPEQLNHFFNDSARRILLSQHANMARFPFNNNNNPSPSSTELMQQEPNPFSPSQQENTTNNNNNNGDNNVGNTNNNSNDNKTTSENNISNNNGNNDTHENNFSQENEINNSHPSAKRKTAKKKKQKKLLKRSLIPLRKGLTKNKNTAENILSSQNKQLDKNLGENFLIRKSRIKNSLP
jgi:hypothetical protein